MFKHKIFFSCKVDQILEHLAQICCGVSILGDAQSLTGHSPELPAVGDHALGGDGWPR